MNIQDAFNELQKNSLADRELLSELRAAARFLRWCKETQKPVDLGVEWVCALTLRLAPLPTAPAGSTEPRFERSAPDAPTDRPESVASARQ